MSSSTQSQSHSDSSFSQLLRSIFSDNSNIMLAAIISLLLVILFVLLLHLYAKWFLAQAQAQAQARRRRRRRRPVTVSDVLGPSRFHHFHTFNLQPDSPVSPSKGLDSAAIAAIPVFVYEEEEDDDDGNNNNEEEDRELECVICLSAFGEGEIGRSLPKCAHAFHLECIDMWLASHSNCPICRAPIMNVSEMGSCVDFGDDSSALLEIVIDSSPTSEINISESESTSTSSSGVSDSAVSISETSSSLLGCSLKRMLSKVFPSNVNDLNQ